VLDAKYHYNFWRPITAIRNGDMDGNPATDREATWQPIANTPMHPEYPCAHCIQSGSVAGVVKAVLGTADIPEIAITSPTAPGVTHRWSNMTAFTEEIANARIWSGFHYRFSTRVGTEMGLQIGEYVAKNVMQPVATSTRAPPGSWSESRWNAVAEITAVANDWQRRGRRAHVRWGSMLLKKSRATQSGLFLGGALICWH
jgi:hypothetical protein